MAARGFFKAIAAYTGALGVLYVAYGVAEAAAWVAKAVGASRVAEALEGLPLSPGSDAIAGLVLVLIGSMLLYRVRDLARAKAEGLAFLLAALILATLLGAMYILIAGADALDAAVTGGEWSFDPSEYNLPAIILAAALSPAWLVVRHRGELAG